MLLERVLISIVLFWLAYMYMQTHLFGSKLMIPLSGFLSVQLFLL
ncbi:hypothetical protein [Exiguobacterium artemiae]